jgi:hypothetical protein
LVEPTFPTDGEGEASKFNFDETFDHPPFVTSAKVVKVEHQWNPCP